MILKKEERFTSQKKIISDYLMSVKTHPSAKEVFQAVKRKLPQISLGTVYRILKNLKEKGKILEISTDVSRFDGDISPHAHFICEKCKKIFDIRGKYAILKIKKLRVGTIKDYQIYFYGICEKCKK